MNTTTNGLHARRTGLISLFRRGLPVVALALVTVFGTGCGVIGRSFGGSGDSSNLSVANESLVRVSKRSPSQLSPQTARILPKPDFGVTPEVQAELDRLLTRERATVIKVLDQNADRYQASKKVFEGQGVPTELLSVAAVESGFNPQAKSPAGARGMWQFMTTTARLYGLKVGRSTDERLDPKRSSEAAARHLRDLFASFQDWHLALAAYNAGSGAVNRVMNAQGETDFWELARAGHLPKETRNFVPRVIAFSMIFEDPSRYGFDDVRAVG